MKLKTVCPQCRTSLKASSEFVGRSVKCPSCDHRFVVQSVRSAVSEKSMDDAVSVIENSGLSDQSSKVSTVTRHTDSSTADQQNGERRFEAGSVGGLHRIARFECQQSVGQGGFAVVYRAWDPVLERVVALKAPFRRLTDAMQTQKILEEARAAARLRHPNIVAVFEAGEDGRQPYIVSEFVEGSSLSVLIKEQSVTDTAVVRDRIKWLIAICRGLAYAHREKIVHRDVKPHNVLMDPAGRPQLTDFGLAVRQLDATEQSQGSRLVGTLCYMSPEQARGDQSAVGPAADQYGAGVVLYECLTGRRPFEGNSHAVLTHIISDMTPRPSSVNRVIDHELDCICLKALAKEAADRYSDCDAMADDLQRWLDGELIEATNPSPVQRGIHWARKRPQLAAWVVTAASLLLLVSGVSITVGVQQHLQARETLRQAAALQLSDSNSQTTTADPPTALETPILAATHQMRQLDYARSLERVSRAISENRIDNAHALLDRVAWSDRHVEHGLLRRQALGTPFFIQHFQQVSHLEWSSDGKILASYAADARIRFWNGETREPLASLELPRLISMGFASHANALVVLQADDDSKPKLMVYRISELLGSPMPHPYWVTTIDRLYSMPDAGGLAVHPERSIVAVVGNSMTEDGGLEIWDLSQPEQQTPVRPNGVISSIARAAFTADGKQLGYVSANVNDDGHVDEFRLSLDTLTITQVDDSGGVQHGAMPAAVSTVDASDIRSRTTFAQGKVLRWSGERLGGINFGRPNPPTAAMELEFGRMVAARELLSNSRLAFEVPGFPDASESLTGHSHPVRCLAMRPDQKCFASGDDSGEIRIWPLGTRTPQGARPGSENWSRDIGEVCCSPDSRFAARSVRDQKSDKLRVWNPVTGETIFELPGHVSGVSAIDFHPSKFELCSVDGRGHVRRWNLDEGTLAVDWLTSQGTVRSVHYSADGTLLVVAGGTHPEFAPDDNTSQNAVPSSESPTTGTSDGVGRITLWNPETGQLHREISGHTDVVLDVAFAAEGDQLISSSLDGTIRIWSVANGQQLHQILNDGFIPVRIAVADSLLTAVLQEPCGVFSEYRVGDLRGTSEKSRYVLTGVYGRGADSEQQMRSLIRTWDRSTLAEQYTLQPEAETFSDVDLSNDGQRLLMTSGARTSICEARSGVRLLDLPLRRSMQPRTMMQTATICRPETRTRTRDVAMEQLVQTRLQFSISAETDISVLNDTLLIGPHGLAVDQQVRDVQLGYSGTLPIGLSADVTYYGRIVDDKAIQLFRDAELTSLVDIESAGSGQLDVHFTADRMRVSTQTIQEQYILMVPYQVEQTFTQMEPVLEFHNRARFSPDHRRILASSSLGAEVYDSELPEDVRELTGIGQETQQTAQAVSPEGDRIARAGRLTGSCEPCGCSTLEVWDTTTGSSIISLSLTGEIISALAFDPLTSQLIVASHCERHGGGVHSEFPAPEAPLPMPAPVFEIAPEPVPVPVPEPGIGRLNSAAVLLTAFQAESENSTLTVRDADSGSTLYVMPDVNGRIVSLSTAAEARVLASLSDDREVQIYDLEQRSLLHRWKLPSADSNAFQIQLSRDGRLLLIRSEDSAAVFSVSQPEQQMQLANIDPMAFMEFTADAELAVTQPSAAGGALHSGIYQASGIKPALVATANDGITAEPVTALPTEVRRWCSANGFAVSAWNPMTTHGLQPLTLARPRHAPSSPVWIGDESQLSTDGRRGAILIWNLVQTIESRPRFVLPTIDPLDALERDAEQRLQSALGDIFTAPSFYSVPQAGEMLSAYGNLAEIWNRRAEQYTAATIREKIAQRAAEAQLGNQDLAEINSHAAEVVRLVHLAFAKSDTALARELLDRSEQHVRQAISSGNCSLETESAFRRLWMARLWLFHSLSDQENQAALRNLAANVSQAFLVSRDGSNSLWKPGDLIPEEPFTVVSLRLTSSEDTTGNLLSQVPVAWPLHALSINGPQFGDGNIHEIERFPLLRELWIVNCLSATGKDLGHLESLPVLVSLGCWITGVEDEELRYVGRHPRLREVNLGYSGKITGAGLKFLGENHRLETLWLEGQQIEGAAISGLGLQTAMRLLGLNQTKVDDASLVLLQEMQTLRRLAIEHTSVGDAGLSRLVDIPLEEIEMSHTRITDLAAAYLKQMPKLRRIQAKNVRITDQFLLELKGKESLRSIVLSKAVISDFAAKEFLEATPNCQLRLE